MKSYVVKIHVFRYFSISRHSRRWEFPKTRFVEPVTLRRGVTMLPCAWKLTWIQIQGHAQIRNWCAAASGLRVLVMLVSLGLFPQAIDKNLKLFSIALKTSLSVSLTLLSLSVVLLTRTEVGRPSIVCLLFFSRPDLAISEKLCLLKLNLRSFVRKFVFRLSKALGIFTILLSYFRCRKFLSRSRCSFLLLQKTFLFPVSQGHYLFELFPAVPFWYFS